MISDGEKARSTKFLDFGDLREFRNRNSKKRIVQCHGVFDVLHAGHLAYFESAKKFGDILVISITEDKFVNKGPGRPYFTTAVRANMIASLEIVDHVVVSPAATAVPLIEELKPNFYVKGPDYKLKAADVTGGIYVEEVAVKKGGGALVFTDEQAFSSSTLINRFFEPWNDEQLKSIEAVNKAGGFSVVEQVLEKIGKEVVTVMGESIVDTYVFCMPEALSSKSPSISAKYLYEENYAGGSLAIANHLCDFVKDISLVTTHGGEAYFQTLLRDKLDPRVSLVDFTLSDIPTPRKKRYISANKSERMFEITDLRADQWFHHDASEFCAAIRKGNDKDSVSIIADFGHGIFEGPVLESLAQFKGFIGLNVQTNSSNIGYNPFTKHSKFSYLSIDTNEARIAYRDKFNAPLDLAYKISKDLEPHGSSFGMTFGKYGAYYFPYDGDRAAFAPAFADSVVDATGAGDAFFALTSLLVKVGCPVDIVPFLGNIFAGLKTKIIGNKSSVTRASLIKAVTSILK